MTIQERKLNLINHLVLTSNVKFIDNVEKLLKKNFSEEYEKKLKPMSEKELLERIYRSEEAIKAGRVIAHEDVVKYFKNKKKK